MTTAAEKSFPATTLPPLRQGDRLSRAEFERRYEAMPDVRAELLNGIVYMSSPVSDDHSQPHFRLTGWLSLYTLLTPGVVGGSDGTVLLGDDSEPQPDAHLRILESHGGQARVDERRYVVGGPELIAEVSVSSLAVDRDVKLPLYQRHGVREALLWRVTDGAIDWFVLHGDRSTVLVPGSDGILRSEVFPGLWLDPAALVSDDRETLLRVAQLGTASAEHTDFVRRLASTAGRNPG